MPLGKPVQGLSGNELLCDLPFELDAVGTLSGHGFHPLKAQRTLSTHEPQLVRPQGRTPRRALSPHRARPRTSMSVNDPKLTFAVRICCVARHIPFLSDVLR